MAYRTVRINLGYLDYYDIESETDEEATEEAWTTFADTDVKDVYDWARAEVIRTGEEPEHDL